MLPHIIYPTFGLSIVPWYRVFIFFIRSKRGQLSVKKIGKTWSKSFLKAQSYGIGSKGENFPVGFLILCPMSMFRPQRKSDV